MRQVTELWCSIDLGLREGWRLPQVEPDSRYSGRDFTDQESWRQAEEARDPEDSGFGRQTLAATSWAKMSSSFES